MQRRRFLQTEDGKLRSFRGNKNLKNFSFLVGNKNEKKKKNFFFRTLNWDRCVLLKARHFLFLFFWRDFVFYFFFIFVFFNFFFSSVIDRRGGFMRSDSTTSGYQQMFLQPAIKLLNRFTVDNEFCCYRRFLCCLC